MLPQYPIPLLVLCVRVFAVAGDALMTRWFGEEQLGLAFGAVFAVGEAGGAVPFYLGSLLQKYFESPFYMHIVFVICFGAAAFSLLSMLTIYVIDRKRHEANVRKMQRTVPSRSIPEYARWVIGIIRRQSKMFWFLFAQCAMLYGGFYTFLAFCT